MGNVCNKYFELVINNYVLKYFNRTHIILYFIINFINIKNTTCEVRILFTKFNLFA